MSTGMGFGKLILFGEHFVVYGIPGIVAGIDRKIVAEIRDSKRFEIENPKAKKEQKKLAEQAIREIFSFFGITPREKPVKISYSGDLPVGKGLGASAAFCVATARAISEHFGLKASKEKIFQAAMQGEKIFHGTPSGIDPTAATFGGIIWFEKGNPNKIEQIKVKKPFEIVMADTGKERETKKAIMQVKEQKEKQPEKMEKIFSEAKELVFQARKAIEQGNIKEVAELANKNHELLREIGVSSKELEELVGIAIDNGAWGAKLTGGGMGGYMFAITSGKKLQEKVAKAIQKKGFAAIKTTVGK